MPGVRPSSALVEEEWDLLGLLVSSGRRMARELEERSPIEASILPTLVDGLVSSFTAAGGPPLDYPTSRMPSERGCD